MYGSNSPGLQSLLGSRLDVHRGTLTLWGSLDNIYFIVEEKGKLDWVHFTICERLSGGRNWKLIAQLLAASALTSTLLRSLKSLKRYSSLRGNPVPVARRNPPCFKYSQANNLNVNYRPKFQSSVTVSERTSNIL